MSELVMIVDDENFADTVLEADVPVIVDYSATWCSPCKMQVPILEEFAAAHLGKVRVVKVDTDDSPKTASRYGIRSIPTLMLFNAGQRLDTRIGLTTFAMLGEMLKKIG
jgi:thioredoxin 1